MPSLRVGNHSLGGAFNPNHQIVQNPVATPGSRAGWTDVGLGGLWVGAPVRWLKCQALGCSGKGKQTWAGCPGEADRYCLSGKAGFPSGRERRCRGQKPGWEGGPRQALVVITRGGTYKMGSNCQGQSLLRDYYHQSCVCKDLSSSGLGNGVEVGTEARDQTEAQGKEPRVWTESRGEAAGLRGPGLRGTAPVRVVTLPLGQPSGRKGLGRRRAGGGGRRGTRGGLRAGLGHVVARVPR